MLQSYKEFYQKENKFEKRKVLNGFRNAIGAFRRKVDIFMKVMKKKYEKPVMEVIVFETEDVITTSGYEPGDYETEILPD